MKVKCEYYLCDICNKQADNRFMFKKMKIFTLVGCKNWYDKEWDLCTDCDRELRNYLKIKAKERKINVISSNE